MRTRQRHPGWKYPKVKNDTQRRRNLLDKYGIDELEYQAMLEAQNGVCAICGWATMPSDRMLAVDHCHQTGRIRGLLCTRCNIGLGHYWHDPQLLRKAADYLGDME